jgi:hypothetical protein
MLNENLQNDSNVESKDLQSIPHKTNIKKVQQNNSSVGFERKLNKKPTQTYSNAKYGNMFVHNQVASDRK